MRSYRSKWNKNSTFKKNLEALVLEIYIKCRKYEAVKKYECYLNTWNRWMTYLQLYSWPSKRFFVVLFILHWIEEDASFLLTHLCPLFLFYTHLKLWLSNVFKGYTKQTLACNRVRKSPNHAVPHKVKFALHQ